MTETDLTTEENIDSPKDAQALLEEENAQLKDQLLRVKAEQENMRKRLQKDLEDGQKFALTKFAKDLLQVSDNLKRAIQAAPESTDEQMKTFILGVEMTEKELSNIFERFHIQAIHPENEKFDHNLHQAMFEIEDTEKEPGTIVQVLQSGYVLHERLLRPALVGVSKKSSEA